MAVWIGALPLKPNQTYSFAAWCDRSKWLIRVGAQGTRVGLFLMVSLKCCSGYFSWENSCREPMERVYIACIEMVRSMRAIGHLSGHGTVYGTRKNQAEKKRYQQSASGTWGHGRLVSGSRLCGKARAGKMFLGSNWSLNWGCSQERGCLWPRYLKWKCLKSKKVSGANMLS